MITFFKLDGLGFGGIDPETDDDIIEELTYVILQIGAWDTDQRMLHFLMEEHINSYENTDFLLPIVEAIAPWVKENKTPQLHIVLWESTPHTQGESIVLVDSVEQVRVWSGPEAESVTTYIERQKAYYAILDQMEDEDGEEDEVEFGDESPD
jgi:hypothetical protein